MISSHHVSVVLLLCSTSAGAFSPGKSGRWSQAVSLNVAVDPTTVTKEDFKKISGAEFAESARAPSFFVDPKRIEVLQDMEPVVEELVDTMVSQPLCARALASESRSIVSAAFPLEARF